MGLDRQAHTFNHRRDRERPYQSDVPCKLATFTQMLVDYNNSGGYAESAVLEDLGLDVELLCHLQA